MDIQVQPLRIQITLHAKCCSTLRLKRPDFLLLASWRVDGKVWAPPTHECTVTKIIIADRSQESFIAHMAFPISM